MAWQMVLVVIAILLARWFRNRKPKILREVEAKAKARKAKTLQNQKDIIKDGWTNGLEYDAANCGSLWRFKSVLENTYCPFAKKAKVWGSADWNKDLSLEDNIKRSFPMLLKFIQENRKKELDGFVFEIQGKEYSSTISQFGNTVRRVLTACAEKDPAEPIDMMKPDLVGRRGWRFSWNDEAIFVTTFAPCYNINHARYCYEASAPFDSCYVLFQPENSFGRHNIGPDHPWDDTKRTIRQKIRQSFKDHGQRYHVPNARFFPTSFLVVPNTDVDGPYIEWWKIPEEEEKN